MASNTDRIEKRALLRAPLARVWRAISDSSQFGTWFGVRFHGAFAPGARLTGKIVPTAVDPEVGKMQKPHEGMTFHFVVERVEPMRLLSFRWHPHAIDPNVDYMKEPTTLVEFTLKEVADGTMLTITESGFDKIPLERRAKAFAANEQGWTHQMKLIEKYLAQNG